MTDPIMPPGQDTPPRPPFTPNFPPVPPRRAGSRTTWWGIAGIVVLVAAVAMAYHGLRAEMNAQYVATQAQLQAIQTDLHDLRQELESEDNGGDDDNNDSDSGNQDAAAAHTVHIDVAGYPSLGNPKASLVMVEFTDFQCPYCARYHATTFPVLRKDYVDTQRMRYVAVDFPLDFHSLAFKAAEASHCAGQQGEYWPIYERLFQATPHIEPANLVRIAGKLGLNTASFQTCLNQGTAVPAVRRGISEAEALGVDGTPTFIIGRAEGSVVRGRMIVGAYPTEVFDRLIRAHLALN